MKYQQLTEVIRYHIALLLGEEVNLSKINSREVRRNWTACGYSAAEAQRLSDSAKRFISPDTVFYVEAELEVESGTDQRSR